MSFVLFFFVYGITLKDLYARKSMLTICLFVSHQKFHGFSYVFQVSIELHMDMNSSKLTLRRMVIQTELSDLCIYDETIIVVDHVHPRIP